MKKSILLLITLLMVLPLAFVACGKETPPVEEAPVFYGSVVVANLSNKAVVEQAGLAANVKYVRDTTYSAEFKGKALKDYTTFPVIRSDFRGATYLEFNMYSLVPTPTNFGLFLVSDNPETSFRDGYYTMIDFNFGVGSFSLSDWMNLRLKARQRVLILLIISFLYPAISQQVLMNVPKYT